MTPQLKKTLLQTGGAFAVVVGGALLFLRLKRPTLQGIERSTCGCGRKR